MTKILFVCYWHGCRGEGLAHKISQHSFFKTLEAKVVGRTVIQNEFYDKKFLNSWMPEISSLPVPTENIVVPSHYFYEDIAKYFPDASYVSIDVPKDIDKARQKLHDRFNTYKTDNLLELVGECENRVRDINPRASKQEVFEFASKILKMKDVTFGDIRCLSRGLEPTEENKQKLINEWSPRALSTETIENTLVIPFEDIDKINIDDIVDYCNKSNGSL